MLIYVKFLLFPYFLFFLVLNHDVIIYIYFTNITASNTGTDDVANYVTH